MSMNKRNEANWLPIVLDDMLKTDWLGGTTNVSNIGISVPAVNIIETADNFIFEVAAPGKNKKDFIIELDNDVLSISSEEKEEHKTADESGRFARKEFSYNTFKRVFGLPESVDREKISASYKHGVLEINLPKLETAKFKAKRIIKIS
ncbi:MAG: Hsp20/alpha crystallin family protein [Gillisia sp.]|nr:Hsp20/alpha crystallin family protein [Gillisia sp.]